MAAAICRSRPMPPAASTGTSAGPRRRPPGTSTMVEISPQCPPASVPARDEDVDALPEGCASRAAAPAERRRARPSRAARPRIAGRRPERVGRASRWGSAASPPPARDLRARRRDRLPSSRLRRLRATAARRSGEHLLDELAVLGRDHPSRAPKSNFPPFADEAFRHRGRRRRVCRRRSSVHVSSISAGRAEGQPTRRSRRPC